MYLSASWFLNGGGTSPWVAFAQPRGALGTLFHFWGRI